MKGVRIGMRWWLAVVFVLIATLTATLIATVATRQADRDLRSRAVSRALDRTLAAGFNVQGTLEEGSRKEAFASIRYPGELAVFLFFGPVAVLGTLYVQTGTLTWLGVAGAVAAGTFSAAVLVANNLRDVPTDRAAGKITLADLYHDGSPVVIALSGGEAGSITLWKQRSPRR